MGPYPTFPGGLQIGQSSIQAMSNISAMVPTTNSTTHSKSRTATNSLECFFQKPVTRCNKGSPYGFLYRSFIAFFKSFEDASKGLAPIEQYGG